MKVSKYGNVLLFSKPRWWMFPTKFLNYAFLFCVPLCMDNIFDRVCVCAVCAQSLGRV